MPMDWFVHSNIGIITLDQHLNPVDSNPAAQRWIWQRLEQPVSNQLPDDFREALSPHLKQLQQKQQNLHTGHLLLNDVEHGTLMLRVEINPIPASGYSEHYLLTLRNASQNARQARELKLFRNAVENTGSAVVITNAQGEIEYANDRFSEMSGYSFAEIRGRKPGFLSSEQTSPETYQKLWNSILNHKKWRGTLLNRRKNGSTYWSLQNISPIHDELGNIINFVSVSEDISQIKEHDAQMEKMAYFDPLTDLGNRRSFRRNLDQHLSVPPGDEPCALLLLDLDHFKQINDTLGHEAGDTLLMTVASRLNFCISQHSSVFRLGGDEFTIILQGCRDNDHISRRAQELLRLLAQPFQVGLHEISITVSIGITLIGVDSHDASDLLRNADLAMYHAKRQGRNTFAFYQEEMGEEAQRTLSIEHDLRNALNENQLHLVFQPQVSTLDGKITAIEALLRWQHPLKGNIPPNDFISHAEETGLIIPIGRWVLIEACKAAKVIQQQKLPPLKVCINLSTRQFDDPSLLQHIEEALQTSALDPRWLELEITESMLMRDMKSAIDTLHRIKAMGISLAIDDFGTGYSSLSYLKKMPVDLLKIDRSFVQDIPQDKDNMAITSTIIAMTRQLGLQVLAEGVETQAQMSFLSEQECHMMQGYLISRPIPFEQFMNGYQACQFYCGVCAKQQSCTIRPSHLAPILN